MGAQVIETLDVEIDGELLRVEAETYMGLSITGLPARVRRVRDLVNAAPSLGRPNVVA